MMDPAYRLRSSLHVPLRSRIPPTILALLAISAPCRAGDPTPAAPAAPGAAAKEKDEIFGLTRIHDLHLTLTASEWQALQPAGPGGFPGFPGAGGPFGGPPGESPPPGGAEKGAVNEERKTHKGLFGGIEFPWAEGTLSAGGKTCPVSLRYKGNGSYMPTAGSLKRNLKVQLQGIQGKGADRPFPGQKALNLNAGAWDPTKAREAISYAVFRDAAVPAPRTAFARVTLTVPGRYDREYVGLYTMVEQVDERFLEDRFKSAKGLLLKPEGIAAFDYLGEDWSAYEDRYTPKNDAAPDEARRVIEFAKLVHQADDERFRKEVDSYLDVDGFLRFLAANAMLVNFDTIFGMPHNYYIYLHPATRRFVYLPWDLDLSLAAWPMGGTPDQQMDLSLVHPHAGPNRLIDRLLAIEEVRGKYRKVCEVLASGCFSRERLLADVEAIEEATKDLIAQEAAAVKARNERGGGFGFGPPGGMFGGGPPDLRTFAEKRTESIAKQLAGERKGYVLERGFGPPGGPGGGPGGRGGRRGGPPGGPGGGPGGPGEFLAGAISRRADADRDGALTLDEMQTAAATLFGECDRDGKGKLDESGLAAAINLLFLPPGPVPGGPGGPGDPPAGGGGPGGRQQFGPGNFLAGTLRKALDAEADGGVTKDEALAGVKKFFDGADKEKKGKIGPAILAEALNRLFPPPPGVGSPPFGPPSTGAGPQPPGPRP